MQERIFDDANASPGLRYFYRQLCLRLEWRPEHKTGEERNQYLLDVLEAVRPFDDLVLVEVMNMALRHREQKLRCEDWVVVCRRTTKVVDKMNLSVERALGKRKPSTMGPSAETYRDVLRTRPG